MKSTLGVALLILALSEAVYINDVAFSAGLTSDKTYNAGQTVVFDKVYVNDGNGYNPLTGIFTCPKAGRYTFQYNVLSQLGDEASLELVHNGRPIVSAFAGETAGYAAAANTAILNLEEGDTVHVRAHSESDLYGRSVEIYASFSGQLSTTFVPF